MNYLKLIHIPVLTGLLAILLTSCPKEADETNVAIEDTSGTPGTTIVETEETPPSDTNIDIHVDTVADEPVVVAETVRTEHPEIVTVLETQVTNPADPATVYIADSPAIQVWTTEVVPANAPADVVYRIRDFNVTNATDTEITADGYVLVTSPSPDFTSERKYVTYTFAKDTAAGDVWRISNLAVTRTEPATPEDLGTAGTADPGATGDTGADMGGASGDTGAGGDSGGGDTGGGNTGGGGY